MVNISRILYYLCIFASVTKLFLKAHYGSKMSNFAKFEKKETIKTLSWEANKMGL